MRTASALLVMAIVSTASAAGPPAGSTPQQAWEWEQREREAGRALATNAAGTPEQRREGIARLEGVLEWLRSDEAKAVAREITWLPYQDRDVRRDLAIAHMGNGSYARAAEYIDALAAPLAAGEWPGTYTFATSLLERSAPYERARSDSAVAAAMARLNAKDPWSRFRTSTFATPPDRPLTRDERVMGVTLLWSELKYNFAHFDKVPEVDWNVVLLDALPRAAEAEGTVAYYRVLQEMAARLKDGHTGVALPWELQQQVDARPPVLTALVEGRVFVTRVGSKKLEDAGLHPGQEIEAVDGVPVVEHGRRREKFTFASTPQDLETRLYSYDLLRGDAATPVKLAVRERDGTRRELSIARTGWDDAAGEPAYSMAMLEGGVAHVKLNSFEDDDVVRRFRDDLPRLGQAHGVIFDVRANGGGSSEVGWAILRHIAKGPFRESRWSAPTYIGAYRAWGKVTSPVGGEGEELKPAEAVLSVPVVVLTSARTYSAAEDFVIVFKSMNRGTVVGAPTGGSTGQPVSISLPGGGSARVCTKRDVGPGGEEFVGKGIAPDVPVAPTAEDLRAGRDPVLERARALILLP